MSQRLLANPGFCPTKGDLQIISGGLMQLNEIIHGMQRTKFIWYVGLSVDVIPICGPWNMLIFFAQWLTIKFWGNVMKLEPQLTQFWMVVFRMRMELPNLENVPKGVTREYCQHQSNIVLTFFFVGFSSHLKSHSPKLLGPAGDAGLTVWRSTRQPRLLLLFGLLILPARQRSDPNGKSVE